MMILTVLLIAGVVIFLAICGYSLYAVTGDWREEYGYRAYVNRIWRKQDDIRKFY